MCPGPAPRGAARVTGCPMQGRSARPAHPWRNPSTGHPSAPPTQTGPGKAKQSLQLSLNPSAGNCKEKKKRQEMGLFDGNGNTFCSLVAVPGLGTLQVSPHPCWDNVQGAEPAARSLALKVLSLLLGPNQPLWDQKSLFGHLQHPQEADVRR